MLTFENIPSFRFLTRAQKHRIFRIPPLLCLFARKARREGLLSLEEGIDDLVDEVDKRDEWFLLNFLRMMVDYSGNSKIDLPAFMKNIVLASGGSKLTRLCRQIIVAGCVDIWEGAHEKAVLYHLASFLGNKWRDDFFTSAEMHYILTQIPCQHSIIAKDGNSFLYPETDDFCESHPLALILNYSPRAIQKVLRDVSMNALFLALKDAHARIRNVFLMNMSERARCNLMILLDDEGEPYDKQKIPEAQQKVLAVIKKLEDEGEIDKPSCPE